MWLCWCTVWLHTSDGARMPREILALSCLTMLVCSTVSWHTDVRKHYQRYSHCHVWLYWCTVWLSTDVCMHSWLDGYLHCHVWLCWSARLWSYTLMCACMNIETCTVMCGYAGVRDCVVTHWCVYACVIGHQHCGFSGVICGYTFLCACMPDWHSDCHVWLYWCTV